MKYLQNKNEFIKDYKSINEAFQMANTGGPGANNVNWGDSLVGRLINSFRRKVGVGTNLVRINQVIKELKRNFEEIIYYSQANALSLDQKRDIMNCLMYQFIGDIQVAIYEQKNRGFASEGEGGSLAETETGFDSGEKQVSQIEDKNYLDEVYSIVMNVISTIKSKSKDGFKADNEKEILNILEGLAEKIKEMKSAFVKESEETKAEEETKADSKDL